MWGFKNLFQKLNFLGDFWEKAFFWPIFVFFRTWFFRPPYFIIFFILTNCSRVNDPPIMGYFKVAISDKTDFWGLKYPPEVAVEHKTCSFKCKTHVRVILSHKKGQGGVREDQNMAQKYPKCQIVKNGDSCKMVTRQEKILKKTQNSAKKTAFSSKIPQEI